MNRFKTVIAVFLVVGLVLGGSFPILAANPPGSQLPGLEKVLADTCAYLLKTVPNPRAGSGGSEWAVIGLARAGYEVPGWYESYYKALKTEVEGKNGVLHDKKYTEYSRAILALTAIGKDPADVGGYNLLAKLGDFEKVLSQGINGPLFALLALDAGNYAIPECAGAKVQTTRELLLGAIIDQQLPDGGFSLGGKEGDADITAMVLQALAPYQEHAAVKTAIDKALVCLSRLQDSDGGYKGFGEAATLESDVQVLIALAALDINPAVDSRFIKNGKTIIDHLLEYALPGGGFKHVLEQTGPDSMATEQAICGLVAYDRYLKGKKGFYEMTDVVDSLIPVGRQSPGLAGLTGKNLAVKVSPFVVLLEILRGGKVGRDFFCSCFAA
ncbi:MAG: prenyltransferase/squalene oxidase repeat-containing protein [Dethiobacteria bacterium]